jgi:putative membrane protein
MTLHELPLLNAVLNGTSALLLVTGYVLIRNNMIPWHRAVMITAFCTSSLFLVSYLIYHYNVGSVPYPGQGVARKIYFTILISHTILAASVPPLAIITLTRGLKKRYQRHRAIARWTLPIWLYVSVTGVVIYLMLYRWA